MTIALFSNVLNSHQIALCDAIYDLNEGSSFFVQTGGLSEDRKALGFNSFERDYLVKASDDETLASRLAIESDIVIFGAECFNYLKLRLKYPDKVTFSYSERWFKQGLKNSFSPNILKQILLYINKGHRRKWYMLAASGYLANDFRKLHIFKNRAFKWGYFPDYSRIPSRKKINNEPVKMLWVARFIDLKRPDIMIKLGKMLIANDYDFRLTMIGDGGMAQGIRAELQNDPILSPRIILKGNCPNDEVLSEMASSDIYCFTSTRREGWGAVLGEAMAAGCCPVASSDAGATPFLINDGKNGLIFKSGNANDLYNKVVYLIEHPQERERMGEEAQKTMLTNWNAQTAAREFISLAKHKLADPNYIPPLGNKPATLALPYNH